MLAFLGAALVGLIAPSGCVLSPEVGFPSRESINGILSRPDRDCRCGECEASCGAPCDDLAYEPADDCERVACPPRRKPWLHWPKLHLYEPEAGIFNFCIPPQCINPPPPLPPGRFFPVPVRPAFAQREESNYGLVRGSGGPQGGDSLGSGPPCANAP